MIRKMIAAVLIALAPAMAFAQKFGHINSADIIPLMSEYKAATTELETLQKQYEEELKYMTDEYEKKVAAYEEQKETLPENIGARREQEIIDHRQKTEQYFNDCQNNLQEKQTSLMMDINTKLSKAIQAVGEENAYVCIFDIAAGVVPYISSTLTTDVTEAVKTKLGIK